MGTCERRTCGVIETRVGVREPAVPLRRDPLDLVDPAVSGQTGTLKNPVGHLFWSAQAGGVKGCGCFLMAFLTGR